MKCSMEKMTQQRMSETHNDERKVERPEIHSIIKTRKTRTFYLNSNLTFSLAPGLSWAALRQALYKDKTFNWTLLCRTDIL
jgi:hypothetical protein